jgi:hypothetical protein
MQATSASALLGTDDLIAGGPSKPPQPCDPTAMAAPKAWTPRRRTIQSPSLRRRASAQTFRAAKAPWASLARTEREAFSADMPIDVHPTPKLMRDWKGRGVNVEVASKIYTSARERQQWPSQRKLISLLVTNASWKSKGAFDPRVEKVNNPFLVARATKTHSAVTNLDQRTRHDLPENQVFQASQGSNPAHPKYRIRITTLL